MTRTNSTKKKLPLNEKVDFLKDPASYPGPTAAVATKETHMSWIFLTERFAYKLKKPVKYPFLDFSTRVKRRQDAKREVRLNSRLAGKTYIGVVRLTLDAEGALGLDAEGKPVDYLVKMHRLPEDRMLDRLLKNHQVPEKALGRAAQRLSDFYRQRTPIEMCSESYLERLDHEIEENRKGLARIEAIHRDLMKRSYTLLRTAFAELQEELGARATHGRLLDGHGDLRPEHICLTNPPVFFDCLEFNQKLRTVDPLDELAYLDIECSRYEHPEAAQVFRAVYRRDSGDPCPPAVFHFYQAKRAFLRASLCAGHLGEEAYDGSREWIDKTHWYLHQTQETLQALRL